MSASTTRAPSGPPSFIRASWRVARGAARIVWVRLRFFLILGAGLLIIGQWENLRNQWSRLTRGPLGDSFGEMAVSGDTEYFCPMDPGVVSDWPSKCGICNMALVRRARGDATPLPDGVIARMQVTPYRLQLAGIRTTPIAYQPLMRMAEGPARLIEPAPNADTPARVAVELFRGAIEPPLDGLDLHVQGPGFTLGGHVHSAIPHPDDPERRLIVEAEVTDAEHRLSSGMPLRGMVHRPAADIAPFRAMPSGSPPLKPGEPRRLYYCMDHPDRYAQRPGRCPQDAKSLMRRELDATERVGWWCPMHPSVVADRDGASCDECGGMKLLPRLVRHRPSGQVLAVPESAVVDTGSRKVVFVERMPGMFDGVEVMLGPRCGDAFPVITGLVPGDHVVSAGAFLLDAETRLNPSLAASYFGATGRGNATTTASVTTANEPDDDGLSAEDRKAIASQKTCPVTRKPLGSMGTPMRVEVAGKVVYLCCEGCEPAIRSKPEKYLKDIPAPTPAPAKP